MFSFTLKQAYKDIPAGVKSFSKKALLLSFLWMVVYNYVLLPSRLPDRWLTNVTANATAFVLGKCYSQNFSLQPATTVNSLGENVQGDKILLDKTSVIFIADPCNALKLFVLYIGFILCIPAGIKRRIGFAAGGVIAIFILNIIRCSALVWLWFTRPSLIDFAHHYVFTLIVYSCIFALWVWFCKKQTANEKI